MTTTGFLHPGAMGAGVAATCAPRTIWVSEGRSQETFARAEAAGLEDVAGLDHLVEQADIIISICPPAAAISIARSVADLGFRGPFVDANAVSPETARGIAAMFERYVDGGIIGGPPHEPGATRMYLSGVDAAEVAGLWEGSTLDVRVIAGTPGTASALKMCFAAWTKGTSALLLAINALARDAGVESVLHDEWRLSIPDLPERSQSSARRTALKAWRFEDEMEQIAATFSAAGLPDGFHRAAAEIYGRLADFKGSDPPPDLAAVLEVLLA